MVLEIVAVVVAAEMAEVVGAVKIKHKIIFLRKKIIKTSTEN